MNIHKDYLGAKRHFDSSIDTVNSHYSEKKTIVKEKKNLFKTKSVNVLKNEDLVNDPIGTLGPMYIKNNKIVYCHPSSSAAKNLKKSK